MQLQIECNEALLTDQSCLLCSQEFELQEARVVVCSEGGNTCGDLCPQCISRGPEWIWQHLLRLSKVPPKTEKVPVAL